MKIRRVEISGFKSFADRVVFSFDDGVTGVVGPNGCGKSNVVDAIRWAMGEQSAKHLRGRSMEDVIFSGSESRPPTGMAEVSITFQNDGRFRELRGELRQLELLSACRQWLSAKEQEEKGGRELQETADGEKVVHAHVARLEAGLSAERLQLLDDERKVQELADRSHGVDKQLRLAEQELQFAQRERESIAARQVQHEDEIGLLGQRLTLLAREEEGLYAERQKLADATAEDETRRAQAEATLQQATERIHSAQHAVETERHQAVGVLTRLANHRTNLVNLERRRQDLSGRLQKTEAEAEQLGARSEEISRQREELSRKLSETQASRRALHERRVAREEQLQQGFSQRRDLEELLIRLREELADRRSRLTSLLELQKNFEGYGRGVKAILLRDEDERRRDGVYGLVADVLRTDARHERAVEAVLGERLQLILVERHAAGLRGGDHLKQGSPGRASVVPPTEMEQLPL